MTEIEPATIEEIESVPGLRTALEVIGHANVKAQEEGYCVIEFRVTERDELVIADITDHVRALEDDSDDGD